MSETRLEQLAACLRSHNYTWDADTLQVKQSAELASEACPASFEVNSELADLALAQLEPQPDNADSLWFHFRSYLDVLQSPAQRFISPGYADGKFALGKRQTKETLAYARIANPKSFNPLYNIDAAEDVSMNKMLFEPLFATALSDTTQVEPRLARTVKLVAPNVYQIKLREGTFWSDGQPITADDLIFTFTAMTDAKYIYTAREQFLKNGQAPKMAKIDDQTVNFEFASAFPLFPTLLVDVPLVPKHVFEKATDLHQVYTLQTPPEKMVVSGPYRVHKFSADEAVHFSANHLYYRKDQQGVQFPYIPRLIALVVPDSNVASLKFRAKEVDLLSDIVTDQYDYLKNRDGAKGLPVAGGHYVNALYFNQDNRTDSSGNPYVSPELRIIFEQLAFRQAADLLIDRTAIASVAFNSMIEPTYSLTTPVDPYYTSGKKRVPSLEQAKAKLHEVRGISFDISTQMFVLPQGEPLKINLLVQSSSPQRVAVANILADDFKKAGVLLEPKPIPTSDYITRLTETHKWEAMISNYGLYNEPALNREMWRSSGTARQWFARKPVEQLNEVDRSIDRQYDIIENAVDFASRKAAWKSVHDTIEDNVLVSPLSYKPGLNVVDSRLCNVAIAKDGNYLLYNLEEVFWKNEHGECAP